MYADATWVSSYGIDPFAVPTADKIALLDEYSGRLLAADGVDHVSAVLNTVKEQTFYADTFGSTITQQRVRMMPRAGGGHRRRRRMRFRTRCAPWPPPMGRGWEALAGDEVWDWTDELAQMPLPGWPRRPRRPP